MANVNQQAATALENLSPKVREALKAQVRAEVTEEIVKTLSGTAKTEPKKANRQTKAAKPETKTTKSKNKAKTEKKATKKVVQRLKDGRSRSQFVRDCLARDPDLSAAEVIKRGKRAGLVITPNLFGVVKHNKKNGKVVKVTDKGQK